MANPGSPVPKRYERPSTSNSTSVYAEFSAFWPTFEKTSRYDSAAHGSASQGANARSTKSRVPTVEDDEIGVPRRIWSDRRPRSSAAPPAAAQPARAAASRSARAGAGRRHGG